MAAVDQDWLKKRKTNHKNQQKRSEDKCVFTKAVFQVHVFSNRPKNWTTFNHSTYSTKLIKTMKICKHIIDYFTLKSALLSLALWMLETESETDLLTYFLKFYEPFSEHWEASNWAMNFSLRKSLIIIAHQNPQKIKKEMLTLGYRKQNFTALQCTHVLFRMRKPLPLHS